MTDDVGIRVAVEPELERNRDAAEDQRTSRDEPVQIVAVANSKATARAVALRDVV